MGLTVSEFVPNVKSTFGMEVSEVLFSKQSPFQKVAVVQTPGFGRVLLIDDLVMLTERDEFVYHEMISHIPLFVHPDPRSVLIIGGGDGGTARECARHAAVEEIDLVDIDKMVTDACLHHIPSVASILATGRVNCRFEDGVAYVKQTDKRYDVVIIDSTDPVSVGEGLFTRDFYQDCFNILREDGILVNQSESPDWHPEELSKIAVKLRDIFPQVHFYHASIPTYPSGHWAFSFASKTCHPVADFRHERYEASRLEMQYYNRELHSAAFALPTFFRKLVYGV